MMTKEELREKCQKWVDENRGKHDSKNHMVDSLMMFIVADVGYYRDGSQRPERASENATRRPKMDISNTRISWKNRHL